MVEMRGGGSGGLTPPPNVQRTLAFMLSRETLQKILDRKTPPPPNCFTLFHTRGGGYVRLGTPALAL